MQTFAGELQIEVERRCLAPSNLGSTQANPKDCRGRQGKRESDISR